MIAKQQYLKVIVSDLSLHGHRLNSLVLIAGPTACPRTQWQQMAQAV